MASKLNSAHNPLHLHLLTTRKSAARKPKGRSFISFSAANQQPLISSVTSTTLGKAKNELLIVDFKTLGDCKLGISRYPDFEYNAQGGQGNGTASTVMENEDDVALVNFDLETLYIPPLTSATTRFLGLPLPPFLKIDIVPELLQGSINRVSGKVDLEFRAKFLFSAGSIYKAQPLMVATVLTSEESTGSLRGGRGDRLDKVSGICKLVGVARVEAIDDILMNTFLGLPTECLASLNASISFND